MGDALPRETENTVYGYLIAISKLRLGILTEQGEGFLLVAYRTLATARAGHYTYVALRYCSERVAELPGYRS